MKIRKVKWDNHPILGNLELDFINPNTNLPYETILFAGENGSGKTTILETISTFLNKGSFDYFEYIEYEAQGQILKAIQPSNEMYKNSGHGFYDMFSEDGKQTKMYTNTNSSNPEVDSNPLNIRFGGCSYSKARANFGADPIKSITNSQLDEDKYDLGNNDNFTSLKQLFVDIVTLDYQDYTLNGKNLENSPNSWSNFHPSSRIFRFQSVSDNFFVK